MGLLDTAKKHLQHVTKKGIMVSSKVFPPLTLGQKSCPPPLLLPPIEL